MRVLFCLAVVLVSVFAPPALATEVRARILRVEEPERQSLEQRTEAGKPSVLPLALLLSAALLWAGGQAAILRARPQA